MTPNPRRPDPDRHRLAASLRAAWSDAARRFDITYEDGKVRRVLRRWGLSRFVPVLRRKVTTSAGRPGGLTFAVFHEVFPDCPVYFAASRLGGRPLHEDPRASLPSLFRRFDRSPFPEEYRRAAETFAAAACGRSLVLIIPRRHLPEGLAVHRGDVPGEWRRGSYFVHVSSTSNDRPWVIQPLDVVLDAVAAVWRPHDPQPGGITP